MGSRMYQIGFTTAANRGVSILGSDPIFLPFFPPVVDSQARTIWIVDAHRDDGRRFIVHADEKISAFVELESAIRVTANWLD
jgi:hypothetical protein